jgi:hypothetical protein
MLNIINEKYPVEREKRFSNCGTHGGTYPGWVATNFFQEELIKKIETLVVRKARESTSEAPKHFLLILQPPK